MRQNFRATEEKLKKAIITNKNMEETTKKVKENLLKAQEKIKEIEAEKEEVKKKLQCCEEEIVQNLNEYEESSNCKICLANRQDVALRCGHMICHECLRFKILSM